MNRIRSHVKYLLNFIITILMSKIRQLETLKNAQLWKKVYFSSIDVQSACDELAEMIEESGKDYKSIYAIPRGGYIPALYLSHRLGIPMQNFPPSNFLAKFSVLVVDDIADTGKTLKGFDDMRIDTVTVCYKPRSTVVPTYYVFTVKDDQWVVFPWESRDEQPNRNR